MSRATQWIALKRLGLSDTAAAVVMGHAMAESACEPNRVQGDSDPARTKSIVYTKWVDSGYVTRDEFIRNGPNGGGYGWLQWTAHDRKAGLYDLAKKLGLSIGSEELAVKWFWLELHQAGYAEVLRALTSKTAAIRQMSDVFMHRFEMPADQSESACAYRAGLCENAYNEFAGKIEDLPTPTPENAEQAPSRAPDMSILMLKTIMAGNGYWDEEINDERTDTFRQRLVEFANDVANC